MRDGILKSLKRSTLKTKTIYYAPVETGTFYHLYNRAIGNEKLFHSDDNYIYFLKKFDEYLSDLLEIYSYCLLPNHFHFLIRTKGEFKMVDAAISEQFRKLFITYSQAINKQEVRKGSLFMKPFKRKPVHDEKNLLNLVMYIHNNPVHHNVRDEAETYKWSSYETIISAKPTKLKRTEVLEWFGDKQNFIYCHKRQVDLKNIDEVIIE